MNKSIRLMITSIALVALVFSLFSCKDSAADVKLAGGADKVLVTIAGDAVTNADIQARYSVLWERRYEQMAEFGEELADEDIASEKERLVEWLLEDFIFWGQVKRFVADNGVEVSQETVDAMIQQVLFFEDLESEEAIYETQLEVSGMDKEAYLAQITATVGLNQYIMDQLQQQGVEIATDEEVRDYYESYKGQFFVKPRNLDLSVITIDYAAEGDAESENPSLDEAYTLAYEISAALEAGEDFNKLAKKNSDSWSDEREALFRENFSVQNSSPLQGEELEKIMALNQGDWSEIIENEMNGYLAIYFADKVLEEREISFELMAESIRENQTIRANREAAIALVEQIKSAYPVQYMDQEEMPEPIFQEEVPAEAVEAEVDVDSEK